MHGTQISSVMSQMFVFLASVMEITTTASYRCAHYTEDMCGTLGLVHSTKLHSQEQPGFTHTTLEKSSSVSNEKFVCFFRDGEDLDSQGDGSSQPDTISIASRTSQNTLDSDKVSCNQHFLCGAGGRYGGRGS